MYIYINLNPKTMLSLKNLILLTSIVFSIIESTFAQNQNELEANPPTLQIGLDQLAFKKGTLDAQLIMEIIAEKQEELKIKAIQSAFLKKVQKSGGTMYSFTDNVVRELVLEKDSEIRTRKILENTVNLVFVTSYLKYYLSTLNPDSPAYKKIDTLAREFGVTIEKKDEKLTFASFIKSNKSNNIKKEKGEKITPNKETILFLALLIDMTSEVVRKNEKLKQLGLMQVSYSSTYEYMNIFLKLHREKTDENHFLCKDFELDTTIINSIKDITKYIKPIMKEHLSGLTNYIGLVNFYATQYSYRNDNLEFYQGSLFSSTIKLNYKKELINNLEIFIKREGIKMNDQNYSFIEKINKSDSLTINTELKSFMDTLKNQDKLDQKIELELENLNKTYKQQAIQVMNYKDILIDSLIKLKKNIRDISSSLTKKYLADSTIISELKNLNKIYFYIEKAINAIDNGNLNPKMVADIIYTFNQEFKPLLLNQSYRDTRYLNAISTISTISNSLAILINDSSPIKLDSETIDPFLLLVSKLYQFDESKTISQYLNLIEDIGFIFPDGNIKDALSTVVTFVKDYTVIVEEEDGNELVSFNVESFIFKLQNIKPYKWRNVQFNFTVGMNNAYFFNKSLTLNDSSGTRNLSYVGEKIGIKFKIKDWAFWHTRNPGDTYSIINTEYQKITPPNEPMVSNLHLLFYSSGLLYNLVNTTTNSEFNMPIVGTGIGLTFFNALDLNFSYGIPIFPESGFKKSFSNGFINLGFDIQFTEYYRRLREKQKDNKTQKQLIKAKTNAN